MTDPGNDRDQGAQDAVPIEGEEPRVRINKAVFFGAAIGIVAFTIWALVVPEQTENILDTIVGWITENLGWFYILLATVVLVFVIFVAISRIGNTKLGPDHSKPEFSTFSWASMLFAAGIGTDLMFFAVAEPVTQYLEPPSGPGQTVEAAREGTVWLLFHYGITGWGMYALMGMALGYFAHRRKFPLAVRSALYPLIGRRIEGRFGDGVDLAAILGTIFGVATTLGIGVVQLNFGLDKLFGVPQELGIQVAIVALGVAAAAASAVSGVDKGIKWLSQLNVFLAIGLAAWILITGKTAYLLNALVLNIGDFIRLFPGMTLQTFAHQDTGDWMSLWTLFFWAWWVAWASFVGMFLARISRGRTIRQFVAGTLTIPFSYILMWGAIYGNAAINIVRSGNLEFGELAKNVPEAGFYTFLTEFPAFTFVASVATFVGLLFYVTSADSGALIMTRLSSRVRGVHDDGSRLVRIFWAAATGAVTIALLSVGGVQSLQYATIIMGLPFSFVLILVMIGLYGTLRTEIQVTESRTKVFRGLLSGRSRTEQAGAAAPPWRERLSRMMSLPGPEKANEYLHQVAMPALREVVDEVSRRGARAEISEITDEEGRPGIELTVMIAEEEDRTPFSYRIVRREVPIPVYIRRVPTRRDFYSRLEVYLQSGGQGYDVMGYTREQLIDDVLDQYEGYLEFLRLSESSEA